MEKLATLQSVALTANFGATINGVVNRVVKAMWAPKSAGIVQLVSKRTSYGGNLILPDAYAGDDAGLTKFKNDVNALLSSGQLEMFGCIVSVHDATDGEAESCTNVANGHVIKAFPRAWDCDNESAVIEAVKRDLRNSVSKGKITLNVE